MVKKLRKIGFSKLTSLKDALEKLFLQIQLNPIEQIDISTSLNRILATDIICDMDLPPFDR